MTTYKITVAVLIALGVGGCVTPPPYRSGTQDTAGRPQTAVLVQAPLVANEKMLHDLFAPDLAQDAPESRQTVKNATDAAQARALAYMQKAMETQTGIRIVTSEGVTRAINRLRINHADTVVTPEIAEQLRAVSGADVILRFRITDYGLTPKSWRKAVIVFEVTTTLAIAAIAYANPATRPIAGVYLVTETIEETAEAYGGFWALDNIYRPVRIEAELITLDTGTQAWKDSATGFSDRSVSRLVRKVGATERDTQLDSALHDAVNLIVADLRKALPQGAPRLDGDAIGK
ncbi:MAG: hypothetical protein HY274_04205 [Gammaproteobacteria bacterium]|nr:hypothetical protein [Gammaproteobacteria bacterium]